MSIRHALHRPSNLAAQPRGKETNGKRQRWCGSNAILAMMAAIFAIVCVVEILHG
ncbi:hypothetical protein JNB91_03945 [Rhizobium wenxiniae]|uniref:hypothetical protein n=1 Tax=Rhizobium wenxiniae TaxID=1737357 RepID=UPI001C6E6A1D|nr:hypothetical protein [Rhizobium wenxiniae]MBW9086990.1 hypothetical protein [Rhizobium wenxiniae]